MKDITINISDVGFPSQFVSEAKMATEEYGLMIGQAIQYEWFRKDSSGCRYYSQWRDFNRLRLYARGEQSVAKYKNELAVDGDLSYLNLDWAIVPVIPKFVDLVVNGMSDRLFSVNAYAQDAMSQSKRTKYQDMIEAQMVSKNLLTMVQEGFGVNPFTMSPEDLPNSNEELALYMQLNYKPAIEIAQEEGLDTLFAANHYDDIRKRVDYDLTVIGLGCTKHEFEPGAGVKISYVDPANLIYSYTEDPHFKDCFYWGEVKTVAITELLKIDQSLSKEDLEEISMRSQQWMDYFNISQYYDNDLFYKDTTTLLYFNYKTTKKYVYKKKYNDNGGSKIIEKDDQFNPPEDMMEDGKFEKVEKTIDVWYNGIMVMGTNIVLKWELAENMVRPKSATQAALPNYVATAPRMYKGVIESLTRRMIPFADLIQLTHLKLQQVIARVVPDGVFIDADGLNEVDLGTGNAYNPEDALRLYFQTGSVVGRSYTQDGDYNQGKVPITQLTANSGGGKTQMLIANLNNYLNMLRQVTGLSEAKDGNKPDANALVGIQKMAALNSNTATRHILDGSLYIYRTLAEGLALRIGDILEYADFKEEFANQIGKYNVSILKEMNELYIYDFGIFIEVTPDIEEKAQLESNISLALSKGDINLEDAIDIREIHNLKLANQLLKMKRMKKEEQDREFEMKKQQQQGEIQMQSQQMAAQTAMQKIQAESQAKMQLEQAKVSFEIERLKAEAELKASLMDKEFQFNQQLRDISERGLQQRESQRESAKSNRISQANNEQSRLINQRRNNLPPQRFESNEDSLDGFDLSEFEPR